MGDRADLARARDAVGAAQVQHKDLPPGPDPIPLKVQHRARIHLQVAAPDDKLDAMIARAVEEDLAGGRDAQTIGMV